MNESISDDELKMRIEEAKDHLDALNEELRRRTTKGWLAVVSLLDDRIQYIRVSDEAPNPFEVSKPEEKLHRCTSSVWFDLEMDKVWVRVSGWGDVPKLVLAFDVSAAPIHRSFVLLASADLDRLKVRAELLRKRAKEQYQS